MVLVLVEETDIKQQKNYEYSIITSYVESVNGEKVHLNGIKGGQS